ncbi:unnamed protein product [Soboliphyme baturini]|uniref:Tudor domain-containing protein n=1 Tax=Soboliphyme baturini TaxID=241478 RepID=A0A183IT40_9BILA|nr:unnamed protein product [Soboliphyme baturini]
MEFIEKIVNESDNITEPPNSEVADTSTSDGLDRMSDFGVQDSQEHSETEPAESLLETQELGSRASGVSEALVETQEPKTSGPTASSAMLEVQPQDTTETSVAESDASPTSEETTETKPITLSHDDQKQKTPEKGQVNGMERENPKTRLRKQNSGVKSPLKRPFIQDAEPQVVIRRMSKKLKEADASLDSSVKKISKIQASSPKHRTSTDSSKRINRGNLMKTPSKTRIPKEIDPYRFDESEDSVAEPLKHLCLTKATRNGKNDSVSPNSSRTQTFGSGRRKGLAKRLHDASGDSAGSSDHYMYRVTVLERTVVERLDFDSLKVIKKVVIDKVQSTKLTSKINARLYRRLDGSKVYGLKVSKSVSSTHEGEGSGSASLFSEESSQVKKNPVPKVRVGSPKSERRKRAKTNDESPMNYSYRLDESETQTLSPQEQMNVDMSTNTSSVLRPGCRVLAKWKDKNFYPGNVLLKDGFGRYKVRFLDGALRDMPQPDIVPISHFKKGSVLMVTTFADDGEEELQPVEIIECPSTSDSQVWYEGTYVVKNKITNSTEKVSWTKLVIDVDQTKSFVTSFINKAAQDVVTENITESRQRRNRGVNTSRSYSPDLEEIKRRRKDVLELSVTKGVSTPDTSVRKKTLKKTETGAGTPKVVRSTKNEEKPPVPFMKKLVRQLIEERGGQVLEDFDADRSNCFLIADKFYRTHKYLSALVFAVPCVSHIWIHNCVSEKKLLDYKNYVLPAGLSLETGRIVEWHSECPHLLDGLTIHVHTENHPNNLAALDFVQIWAPLLKCMGGEVLPIMPDPSDPRSKLDILLTDASCTKELLGVAEKLGADVVSSEWLIQAIITGERPVASNNVKYRFDYVESASES